MTPLNTVLVSFWFEKIARTSEDLGMGEHGNFPYPESPNIGDIIRISGEKQIEGARRERFEFTVTQRTWEHEPLNNVVCLQCDLEADKETEKRFSEYVERYEADK